MRTSYKNYDPDDSEEVMTAQEREREARNARNQGVWNGRESVQVDYSVPGWGVSDEDFNILLQCWRRVNGEVFANRLTEARTLGRPIPRY
jgi:hypothetical protein